MGASFPFGFLTLLFCFNSFCTRPHKLNTFVQFSYTYITFTYMSPNVLVVIVSLVVAGALVVVLLLLLFLRRRGKGQAVQFPKKSGMRTKDEGYHFIFGKECREYY